MNRQARVGLAVLGVILAAACARSPVPGPEGEQSVAAAGEGPDVVERALQPDARTSGNAAASGQDLPTVLVHKSASCGCCSLWVDHMRAAGFTVDVRNTEDLTPIKASVGVPAGMGSCHTAQVGDYFVEGHVPAADVKRLLAERPDAKGLVLPGMPMGSPGMETPDGSVQPFAVGLVRRDGSTEHFAQH